MRDIEFEQLFIECIKHYLNERNNIGGRKYFKGIRMPKEYKLNYDMYNCADKSFTLELKYISDDNRVYYPELTVLSVCINNDYIDELWEEVENIIWYETKEAQKRIIDDKENYSKSIIFVPGANITILVYYKKIEGKEKEVMRIRWLAHKK